MIVVGNTFTENDVVYVITDICIDDNNNIVGISFKPLPS